MSITNLWTIVLLVYLGLNFLCALVLHVHAERQAHLPVRFLDVLVHFVLLTAFAIPVLLFVAAEAVFGGKERPVRTQTEVAHVEARAA